MRINRLRFTKGVKTSFFFFLAILPFIINLSFSLFKEPPIWPDEAIYADVAHNLLKESRLGTDLWGQTIPGVKNHALWYPPAFFYSLAIWFKIFGFSIINQRLLSVLMGFLLLLFIFLLRRSFLLLFLLGLDFTFLKAVKVSRPEIFILFFGIAATYFLQKYFSKKNQPFFIFLSGLFSGLAFLNHTIGIFFFFSFLIFFLAKEKLKILKSKSFYFFLFGFSLAVFLWLISLYPNFDLARKQMALAAARKKIEKAWFWIALHHKSRAMRLLHWSYLFTSLAFLVKTFFGKKNRDLLLIILLISSWLFSVAGRMFWYFVLPIPFLYLGLVDLIKETKNPKLKGFLLFFCLILSLLGLRINDRTLKSQPGDYFQFLIKVSEVIPEGKTIFLSSVPDAYYAFKDKGNNRLYEFPVLATAQENYLEILDDSDFVIYNGSYEQIIFNDFLKNYLEKNTLKVHPLERENSFGAEVIELTPKNQRLSP